MTGLGFLLPLLLPVLAVAGHLLGGIGDLAVPVFIFLLLPLLDAVIGEDRTAREERGQGAFFDALLYLYVPTQLALLAWAALAAASTPAAMLPVLALSVGVVTGGIGITVAHELGHRRRIGERVLSIILLSTVSYVHFLIEHNKGHHARVATPEDPATARFGESFYRFLPRTLRGSLRGAAVIERRRLEREGHSPWSLRNRMYIVVAAPLTVLAGMASLGGTKAAILFVVQSAVAIMLLEAVNYIEHYGLERARRPDGTYAKVGIEHSWNASFTVTNWFLFNLQRHSHHHVHQSVHYEHLRDLDESPRLPAGYATLVPLALLPPLWNRLMAPRVERFRALHGMGAGKISADMGQVLEVRSNDEIA